MVWFEKSPHQSNRIMVILDEDSIMKRVPVKREIYIKTIHCNSFIFNLAVIFNKSVFLEPVRQFLKQKKESITTRQYHISEYMVVWMVVALLMSIENGRDFRSDDMRR